MSNGNALIGSSGGTEGNLIHSPFSPFALFYLIIFLDLMVPRF